MFLFSGNSLQLWPCREQFNVAFVGRDTFFFCHEQLHQTAALITRHDFLNSLIYSNLNKNTYSNL